MDNGRCSLAKLYAESIASSTRNIKIVWSLSCRYTTIILPFYLTIIRPKPLTVPQNTRKYTSTQTNANTSTKKGTDRDTHRDTETETDTATDKDRDRHR